ncbi:MAG: PH domain-containing protein [Planctomycetales bacterium]|nr:PH domain-containing protein [Planctomycetales bacterium]
MGHEFPAEQLKDQLHPPDDEPEVLLWKGGYSGRAMYGSWMVALLFSSIVAAVCLGVLNKLPLPQRLLLFVLISSTVWISLGLLLMYRKLSVRYELTTQRFVHKAGILVRRTDRIELLDVDDVTFLQSIIQRLFGVGTIRIESSDRTHPQLDLIGIADVENVYNTIDDARRRERRRRGLHIENI